MKLSARILILVALLISTLPLGAFDKLTTVAIVDIDRVYTSFFEQSAAVREYNRVRTEIQDTLRSLTQELVKLTEARLAAQGAGNQPEVLRLEGELQAKARYINEFRMVKNQELANMKAALERGDEFKNELDNAIEYIAISQGFTIVLQSSNEGSDVYWWSSEVDITSKVLEHLRRTLR